MEHLFSEEYRKQAQAQFEAQNRKKYRRTLFWLIFAYVGVAVGLTAFTYSSLVTGAFVFHIGHASWWYMFYFPVDTAFLIVLLAQWHSAAHRYEEARSMLGSVLAFPTRVSSVPAAQEFQNPERVMH